MNSTAKRPYAEGEPLVWTSVEQDMPTRRGVEFLSLVNGGHSATVKWAGQNHIVPLDSLSRAASPNTPPPWLQNWYTVKSPPTPPTEDQLQERLAAARQALGRAHQHVKDIQSRLDQARQVLDRAEREHNQALAALRSHDAHQRAAQARLEEDLRLNRPTAATLQNGHGDPRSYLTDRRDMTAAALEKFKSDVASEMAAMNQALSAVRKGSAEIISLLIQQETEALRRLEIQAALARSALLSVVNHWFGGAEIGPIQLPAVTATYLEVQPAFQEVMEVRETGPEARIRPWRDIFDRLVSGDVEARLGEAD